MKDIKNLHNWVARVRGEEEKQWQFNNPGCHPVEWSKYLALRVLSDVKALNLEEIYCHEASFHGTVDYSYIISYLEEGGILVKKAER